MNVVDTHQMHRASHALEARLPDPNLSLRRPLRSSEGESHLVCKMSAMQLNKSFSNRSQLWRT